MSARMSKADEIKLARELLDRVYYMVEDGDDTIYKLLDPKRKYGDKLTRRLNNYRVWEILALGFRAKYGEDWHEPVRASRKDNCPKKPDKPKKPEKGIYRLQATYRQCDPKVIGVYDSMNAMMRGFAKSIAEEIIGNPRTGAEEEVGLKVAKTLADLIPAFFDKDYPRDEEGHIRYGKTTYGYETCAGRAPLTREEAKRKPRPARWAGIEYHYAVCTKCGGHVPTGCETTAQAVERWPSLYPFCPHCGTPMRSSEYDGPGAKLYRRGSGKGRRA